MSHISETEIPIDESPFVSSLLNELPDFIDMKSKMIKSDISVNNLYKLKILEICLRISALFQTLKHSRLFLGERINNNFTKKSNIKNGDFIRYHIEAYFLRITTYKDLVLKLINRTYKFGIKENIGLEKNLSKLCARENHIDLSQLLERLNLLLSNINPIRHKIAHGGYHDDLDLLLIESHDLIRKDNYAELLNNREYNDSLNSLLKRNILEMYEIEKIMANFILSVYKSLYIERIKNEKEM